MKKKQILDFLSKVKTGFSNLFKPHFRIVDNHIPNNPINIISIEKKMCFRLTPIFFPIKIFYYDPTSSPESNMSRDHAVLQAKEFVKEEIAGEFHNVIFDSRSGLPDSQINL